MNDQNDIDYHFSIANLLQLMRSKWYYFIFSLLIAAGFVSAFVMYATPLFKVGTSIYLKDDDKVGQETDLLKELSLFNQGANIENEKGKIKSHSLIYSTIIGTNSHMIYFQKNNFNKKEIYEEFPFAVEIDTNYKQPVETHITIKVVSANQLRIEIDSKNIMFYDFTTKESHIKQTGSYQFSDVTNCGEYIGMPNFKMKFSTKTNCDLSKLSGESFGLIIKNPNRLTEEFIEKLNVSQINNESSIIDISADFTDIKKGKSFLNELTKRYIENDLNSKNAIARNTISFIDAELSGISKSLTKTEDQLELYRQENQVISLEEEVKSIQEIANQVNNQMSQELVQSKYYNYLYDILNKETDFDKNSIPNTGGIEDQQIKMLLSELITLSMEKSKVTQYSNANSPVLQNINNKIQIAKKSLIENLKGLIKMSQLKIESLNERIALNSRSTTSLPIKERKLFGIQRNLNLDNELYNYLLQKRSEASIAKASNLSNIVVLDKPRMKGDKQVYPKTSLLYFGALIFAILFSFSWLLVKEYLTDVVNNKEFIDKLGVPLLGTIGHENNNHPIPIYEFPKSEVSESIRSIRISLQYLAAEKKQKILGFTSGTSGDGKTFCSINLAAALALADYKTIVIGTDMRNPRISSVFKLNNDIGLSSYLIDRSTLEEIISPTYIKNLDVITSGPIPPNPAELLGSKRMDELFHQLSEQYEYIIIDSSPIGLVSDYYVLNKFLDANIFVLRYNYSPSSSAKLIQELGKSHQLKNPFIILNDYKRPNGSKKYYGYYDESDRSKLGAKFKRLFSFSSTTDK